MQTLYKRFYARLAIMTAGTVMILDGCDPSIETAVEDGIINISTAGLTSFLTALVTVATEAANA